MSPRTISRRSQVFSTIASVLVVVVVLAFKLVGPYTDWLWFRELGQTSVFTSVLRIRTVVFLVAGVLAGVLVLLSAALAYRSRPMFIPVAAESPIARYRTVVEGSARLFGLGLPIVVGLLTGYLLQSNWQVIELFLHGSPFGAHDPQFHRDISFYVFDLPFYELVLGSLEVLAVICFATNLFTHYLFDGIRPSRKSGMLTRSARVQLAAIAGVFLVLKAVGYWLDQYELLFSERRVQQSSFIGGYTDTTAVLPAKLILMAIAVICAAAFFAAIVLRDLRVPALATALMLLSAALVGSAWPASVQWLTATPNAREVERPYIDRNIAATRQAFKITDQDVQVTSNWGASPPSPESIRNDTATLSNLRVLDPNLLSPTFTQQERRRSFYGFPGQLAIDRYQVDGQLRDYVVAVRELATANLNGTQVNWQNRHMVYTHGNGFVAAPANQVAVVGDSADPKPNGESPGASQGGFPVFGVSDLAALKGGNAGIPPELRVTQPRVYYGELIAAADPDYAIVGGPKQEYDDDGVPPFSYDGSGGIPVGSFVNRLAFAMKYWELNFFRSEQITDQSKLIFVRDPRERVAKLAPWLTLDEKAYPAVVDGRIQWIVDGYTTLSQYPYVKPVSLRDTTQDSLDAMGNAASRREQLAGQVSYIRNSVKATVDAYDGTVALYQQDEQDPVLRAWMGVFPGLVKAKSEIPSELARHFRYPEDLFKVQRALLTRYHVSDPKSFFDGSELWSVPGDPTQSSPQAPSQPPYYMVAADPNQPGQASFQLTTVMTPQSQPYLAAHISAASDPGHYGKITVKELPTTSGQIPGPSNVYGRLRTTDRVNQEITLLSSADIRYGNLLTVPVGDGGLLYLEPIYTQAKNQESAFPTLSKVYVFFNGKVGFQSTVEGALKEALKQAGIDIDLRSVITPPLPAPAQQGAPPQQQPSPQQLSPQQLSPQSPTTGRPDAQAQLQVLGAAVDDAQKSLGSAHDALQAAKDKLGKAKQSGDFAALGQALADQQRAVDDYGKAVDTYQKAVSDLRRGLGNLVNAPN